MVSSLPSIEKTNQDAVQDVLAQNSPQPDSMSSLRYDYAVQTFDESSHYGRLLSRVGHNKKVLELGSSTGYLSQSMTSQFGCNVTGVEVDQDAAESARAKGQEVFVLDLDQANLSETLAGRRFDVVLCADVLEHLRCPERIMAQLPGLLNEDGYVICSIPHVGHGDVKLSLLGGRMPYRPMGLLDHTHVRFFTRALVEEMLEGAGMRVVSVERNRWQTTKTEVQGRLPSALSGLTDFIAADRESETYQFIVKAAPYRTGAPETSPAAAPTARVDVVVIDQDSAVADDLYQKYLSQIRYPSKLLKFWFVSEAGGLALVDKPKGEAQAYQDSDFRTFRFAACGDNDPHRTVTPPVWTASAPGSINRRVAEINVAQTLAQVARGSDAKYIFVLLANALPGTNCLSQLVRQAESQTASQVESQTANQVESQTSSQTASQTRNPGASQAEKQNLAGLAPLLGARPELRASGDPAPASAEGDIAWHEFSAMLIPRDFLTESQGPGSSFVDRQSSGGRHVFPCLGLRQARDRMRLRQLFYKRADRPARRLR